MIFLDSCLVSFVSLNPLLIVCVDLDLDVINGEATVRIFFVLMGFSYLCWIFELIKKGLMCVGVVKKI